MTFLDNLRKKAEELDLETKARQLQEAATHAAQQAREKAAEFTAEHRDQIDGYVETAGAKIDEKTDHRYASQIAKVKEQLGRGVDLVAEGHGPAAGTATSTAAASGSAPGGGDEPFPADPDAPGPVSAGPLEPPAPLEEPTPVHASDLSAAEAQEPVSRQDPSWEATGEGREVSEESLVDTALEDTVLGLDHPPVAPTHHDQPTPEDADEATMRSTGAPHEGTS